MSKVQEKTDDPDSFEIAQFLLKTVREQYSNQPESTVLGGFWIAMQGLYGPHMAIMAMNSYSLTLANK